MARIRSVHPGLFTDDNYMGLSPLARLLVIGVWCESDDQGIFEWRPRTLKARLLPADNVDIEALLAELVDGQFVTPFTSGGRNYGAVRNFRKYQRPKKPNSIHPLPVEYRTYVALCEDGSEPVPHQFPTEGENPPQMEDVGGRTPTHAGRNLGKERGKGRKGTGEIVTLVPRGTEEADDPYPFEPQEALND